ncbi:HAD-IA family hydrolase [Microbacterium sp. NPDC058342]|uniref:HAD-IA family hydrolase n=1 Tax=Microbacterium sp. NPDC058342 TaxID=3346454 RepID=UPI003651D2A0
MTATIRARAVLLDMDGTLVDSTAVVEKLWLEWAKPHGIDPERVLSVVHGRQGHESMAILLPERDPAINLIENDELLARESADVEGVVEIPGAGVFLRALEGAPHAIVTSANVELMTARMRASGLVVPSIAITAESVKASKPHPEGFLLGAESLGIAAEDCVVFEDSGAGVQAGIAAGMRVVGVGAHAATHGATYAVPDLTGVSVRVDDAGIEIVLP